MQVGLIGLGKMGLNLAFNLNDHGHNVVGYDRNPSQTAELESAGLVGAASIKAVPGH